MPKDSSEGNTLAREIERFLTPLKLAARDEYQREALFSNAGWNAVELPLRELAADLEKPLNLVDTVVKFGESPPKNLKEYEEALSALGDLINLVSRVGESTELATLLEPEDFKPFGADLVSVLVSQYLQRYHPVLHQFAWVLTVFEEVDVGTQKISPDGTPLRIGGPAQRIAFDRLGDLLTDPVTELRKVYFGSKSLDDINSVEAGMRELLPRFATLLSGAGLETHATTRFSSDALDGSASLTKLNLESSLSLGEPVGAIYFDPEGPTSPMETNGNGAGGSFFGEVSIAFVFYFDPRSNNFSVLVEPLGSGSLVLPTGGWLFSTNVRADIPGLAITPDGVKLESATDGMLSITAEARKAPEDGKSYIIGGRKSTRIELGTLATSARAELATDEKTFTLLVKASDSALVVSAGDGDSFLQKVLPDEDLEVNFDFGLGWNSRKGVHIEGSGGTEATIPLHIEIAGVVKIRKLKLAVVIEDGTEVIPFRAGLSPTLSLGPLDGVIENVGLEANLSFPEDKDGNLGPIDLDMGFNPPSGVGLGIDASVVTGGGYLAFYPEENRYSGAFELQITDLGVTVVGLLKTKLPETDGFSLLVIITADLPAVQLGFGFVLTGIGGLGGINRGFEEKPLGKAIRSGNVRSVLFPKNVVANANQIITDLRSFFPARADQHVFGPMLEVGWGTPTVLQMQLGVLVSIPTWKIAIVGNISMALPDEKAGLIVINLAVIGVLDLPNQELSIDASLYDSRIIKWSLSGDMAMRLSYGADPRFLLSIGSFHPRYSPPTGFPSLQRVKASMSPPSGNPRLELTGYLAITPNTFQVGAQVTLAASAGPARVFGQLGFDALFRFNPFSFVVDFYATLKVRVKGKGLSISVDGTLSGPQPFRVKGKVKISILFFTATVRVNAQIGPGKKKEEKLPIAKILPKLKKQVAQPGSWTAQQPDEETQWVRLRDRHADEKKNGKAPDSDLVLAHPRGTLGVRQQVVPLEMRIEKYGNAKPAHATYRLVSLTVKNADAEKNLAGQKQLTEKFAPAKFRKMSDEEKLEAEAFEDLPAGRTLVNGLLHVAGAPPGGSSSNGDKFPLPKEATLDFEATAIDETNGEEQIKAGDLPPGTSWTTTQPSEIGQELKETSRVATGGMRTEGRARYRNDRDPNKLSVADDRYVVVRKSTMERLKVSGTATKNPASGQPRVQALDAKKEYLDAHPDERGNLQVVATSEVAG